MSGQNIQYLSESFRHLPMVLGGSDKAVIPRTLRQYPKG